MNYNQTYSWQPWSFRDSWYMNYYTKYVETLYYLALNTKPIPVFNRTSQGYDKDWRHSDIVSNSSGTYLYEEMLQVKYTSTGSLIQANRIINVTEINKELAYFNIQHNLNNNGTFNA